MEDRVKAIRLSYATYMEPTSRNLAKQGCRRVVLKSKGWKSGAGIILHMMGVASPGSYPKGSRVTIYAILCPDGRTALLIVYFSSGVARLDRVPGHRMIAVGDPSIIAEEVEAHKAIELRTASLQCHAIREELEKRGHKLEINTIPTKPYHHCSIVLRDYIEEAKKTGLTGQPALK